MVPQQTTSITPIALKNNCLFTGRMLKHDSNVEPRDFSLPIFLLKPL